MASHIKQGWAWANFSEFFPLFLLFLVCFILILSAMASKHHSTPQKHLFQLWILPVLLCLLPHFQCGVCVCVCSHHIVIYSNMIVSDTHTHSLTHTLFIVWNPFFLQPTFVLSASLDSTKTNNNKKQTKRSLNSLSICLSV